MNEDTLGLVGVSTYMHELRQEIRTVAAGEFPVLVQGDSGTGKELIALAIHHCSSRRGRPLVSVNCAAIPRALEESEFFGHTRGAFTGAHQSREGLVSQADGSTLFLDEIAETSLEVQAKLLRVLDTGDYLPIGSSSERKASIRVVSATNRDLEEMVGKKQFREDLYYRLKGVMLTTRPLRRHQEDIPVLARHFLQGLDDGSGGEWPSELSARAGALLQEYRWPGNVRELRYTMEVLRVAAAGSRVIDTDAVQRVLNLNTEEERAHERYAAAKAEALREFDSRYFRELLGEFGGNVSQVARAAGMHRPNVVRKLKTLGLRADDYRQ